MSIFYPKCYLPIYSQLTLLGLVLATCFLTACGKKSIPPDQILAKVGDRLITIDEFIRRAEYTIRPPYCNQDNYIHRKIILNSLIAEKLLALEAGNTTELDNNTEFQAYIRGRQEQAMRQYFFYERAYRKVKLNPDTLRHYLEYASRKYEVDFVRLPDLASVNAFLDLHRTKGLSFQTLAQDLVGEAKIPHHTVSFADDFSREFFNLFYAQPLHKGQLLGPIQNEDGSYLLMQVTGWTSSLAITERQIQQRYQDVQARLTDYAAADLWANEVSKIMHGKRLEFDEKTFYQLVKILAPLYLQSQQTKEKLFNQRFWQKEVELDTPQDVAEQIAGLRQRPFFTIDNQVWTVGDFEQAVQAHPLVFRKRRLTAKEFPEQFKYAIADLIRDIYINRVCYKAGYDHLPSVQNYTAMWRDNLKAIYHRNAYLKKMGYTGNFAKEYQNVLRTYLNPYLDSLQNKYRNIIAINTDALEKIKLSRIDMFVLQRGVAYPIVSPAFPILTTDNKLDYGRKLVVKK